MDSNKISDYVIDCCLSSLAKYFSEVQSTVNGYKDTAALCQTKLR